MLVLGYLSACTLCEFLTGIAYVMEDSGGLNDDMSDRVDELIEPIRTARDWLWFVGKLMSQTKPLPEDLDLGLEAAEIRALDALPKFKALIGEACDQLVETAFAASRSSTILKLRGGNRAKPHDRLGEEPSGMCAAFEGRGCDQLRRNSWRSRLSASRFAPSISKLATAPKAIMLATSSCSRSLRPCRRLRRH